MRHAKDKASFITRDRYKVNVKITLIFKVNRAATITGFREAKRAAMRKTMTSTEAAIRIESLSKTYKGGKRALDDVTFEEIGRAHV